MTVVTVALEATVRRAWGQVCGVMQISPSNPSGIFSMAASIFFAVTIKKSAIGKIAATPSARTPKSVGQSKV